MPDKYTLTLLRAQAAMSQWNRVLLKVLSALPQLFCIDYCDLETEKNQQPQNLSTKQHIHKAIFIQERGIWSRHSTGIPLFTISILVPVFISTSFMISSNLVTHSASLSPTSTNNACFTRPLLHISSQKLLNNNRTTVTAQENTKQAGMPLNKYKLLILL